MTSRATETVPKLESRGVQLQDGRGMMTRRSVLRTIGALTLGGAGLGSWSVRAVAMNEPQETPFGTQTSQRDPAVQHALRQGWNYLASIQDDTGRLGPQMGSNAAVVSLAGLAWIAGGSLPQRGPYGREVTRAMDYVANACSANGLILQPDTVRRGPMYDQGFATLFLAEVLGMSDRRDLDEKVRAAVGLILKAQNNQGGWRYTPEPLDADLSVTICQMMALRAARNAGIFVPGEAIAKAVDYVRRSQNTDGGFMYQLEGGDSRFPLTAGAIVALQNAGEYRGKELDLAYAFLDRRMEENIALMRQNYFYYAHYYAAQAMWQKGGEVFERYYESIRRLLLGIQKSDGSWDDVLGRHYGTAMACLILSTPTSLLPIFQR